MMASFYVKNSYDIMHSNIRRIPHAKRYNALTENFRGEGDRAGYNSHFAIITARKQNAPLT